MNAASALIKYGKRLVGKNVMTEPYGKWKGGIATVTKLRPDRNAPEIVFEVRHPTQGSIGVFDHENIEVLK